MLTVDPQNNIDIDRGDGELIKFSITDSLGALADVSAWSFLFTVKQYLDDAIANAKFQKSIGAGITVHPSGQIGIVNVQLSDADTQALAGDYVYDLQGVYAGLSHTVAKGRFRVSKDITTPGSAGQPTAPSVSIPGWISFAGAEYHQDQTTLQWYKTIFENGSENTYGPSATIPF